ncbi:hypothetical protein [Pseudobythopirellula maris]|uniref:hypothetical protein n=1 Tax=Pseudobythopirellula maris TaxID=2527991 RepID=UPI0011B43AE0|nr:hypothetical protein [Pseudobythopirellula maris]
MSDLGLRASVTRQRQGELEWQCPFDLDYCVRHLLGLDHRKFLTSSDGRVQRTTRTCFAHFVVSVGICCDVIAITPSFADVRAPIIGLLRR